LIYLEFPLLFTYEIGDLLLTLALLGYYSLLYEFIPDII